MFISIPEIGERLKSQTSVMSSEVIREQTLKNLRDQVRAQLTGEYIPTPIKQTADPQPTEEVVTNVDNFIAGTAQPMVDGYNFYNPKDSSKSNPTATTSLQGKRKLVCTSLLQPKAKGKPRNLNNISQERSAMQKNDSTTNQTVEMAECGCKDAEKEAQKKEDLDFDKLPRGTKKDKWSYISPETGIDESGQRTRRLGKQIKALVMKIVHSYANFVKLTDLKAIIGTNMTKLTKVRAS